MILSFQSSGSAASGFSVTNQISLNFTRIEKEYRRQKEDGTIEIVKAGWDLKAQRPDSEPAVNIRTGPQG